MDSEIELKLLVSPESEKDLKARFIPSLNVAYQEQSKQLHNAYYDTPDQALRSSGIGLRVRGCNGKYEQTIKAGGASIGGLHQRLEYNIPLSASEPDLSLFPKDVWQDELEPSELSTQIIELFNTNFQRQEYLLSYADGGQIELVFDSGLIETHKHQADICEIELELKRGEPASLFALARQLREMLPYQLGSKSKAQRGYELYLGTDTYGQPELSGIQGDKSQPASKALFTSVANLYSTWQMQSQIYLETGKPKELVALKKVMALLCSNLRLLADFSKDEQLRGISQALETALQQWQWIEELEAVRELLSKKGFYRKKLAKQDGVIALLQQRQSELLEQHKPQQALQEKQLVLVQLQLLEFIATGSLELNNEEETVNKFAKKAYKDALNRSTAAFQSISNKGIGDYLAGLACLQECDNLHLLFGAVVGSRYRLAMDNWIDLKNGIEELRVLLVLEQHLRSSASPDSAGVIAWCLEKQAALLNVIGLSQQSAVAALSEY